MRQKARIRNLDLAAFYLTDGAPQDWPDPSEYDERPNDLANLTARSFEFRLDLLDGGFGFDVVKFSKASNVKAFSRLSMLLPRHSNDQCREGHARYARLSHTTRAEGRDKVAVRRWDDEMAPRGQHHKVAQTDRLSIWVGDHVLGSSFTWTCSARFQRPSSRLSEKSKRQTIPRL